MTVSGWRRRAFLTVSASGLLAGVASGEGVRLHGNRTGLDDGVADELTVDELVPEYYEAFPLMDAFDAEATVTNPTEEATSTVAELRFKADGRSFSLQETVVTVEANSSEKVRFEDIDIHTFEPGTKGEYGVFISDDAATGTLLVTELPGELAITEVEPNEITVQEGSTFDIAVTLENDDHFWANDRLEFEVDDVHEFTSSGVAAESSDKTELTDIDTTELQPGSYEYTISTDGDTETGTLTIESEDDGSDSGTDSDGGGDTSDDDSSDDGDGDGTNPESDSTETATSDDSDTEVAIGEDEVPGFGVGTALTGLAGGGYLLKRQLSANENKES